MKILERAHRNRLINSFVKWFRINRLCDGYLSRFPVIRKTSTGLIYKVESVPSLIVANEIFGTGAYAKAIEAVAPSTFVDLGANVGYFPVAVASLTRSRGIRGLCVEPNPALRDSVMFHIEANKLENVHFRQGAVGPRGAECRSVDFFINPSHIASSLSGRFNPLVPVGGKSQRIRVPLLDLPEEWNLIFPGDRVDLLKIDIEGAEMDFLQSHASFLERVDAIVMEWHNWTTSFSEVRALLERSGILLQELYKDDQHAGAGLFRRPS